MCHTCVHVSTVARGGGVTLVMPLHGAHRSTLYARPRTQVFMEQSTVSRYICADWSVPSPIESRSVLEGTHTKRRGGWMAFWTVTVSIFGHGKKKKEKS